MIKNKIWNFHFIIFEIYIFRSSYRSFIYLYDERSKLKYIFIRIIKFIVSECCNDISHWYTRRVDYWWCVGIYCKNVSIYAFECDWSKWSLFEGKRYIELFVRVLDITSNFCEILVFCRWIIRYKVFYEFLYFK